MRQNVIRLCIIAAVAVAAYSFKQAPNGDPIEARILNAINIFYQAYPQEKIHLQFSKNKYAPGEEIWYKAYVQPVLDTAYTTISKIMYVELVDANNNLVKREVLPVENGTAPGHFSLSNSFAEGVYHVRAYTAWMLNFDSSFFFNRDIPVYNGNIFIADSLLTAKNYTLHFYPEGGNLVSDLTSVMAYKAEDANGNPVKITGKIMDDKGTLIANLQTGDDGLGSCRIHPIPGNMYSVSAQLANGISKTFALPEIKKSGIVLHVEDKPGADNNSHLFFHISRSKTDRDLYGSIIVCAHTAKYNRLMTLNFDTSYAGDFRDTIMFASTPIDIKNDVQGIVHITIFNKDGEPLADRIVVQHNVQAVLNASLKAATVSAAGQNEFTLTVPEDADGQYSVSVTLADDVPGNDRDNIMSDFNLPALQNKLHNPSAYFNAGQAEARRRLDMAMLTSNWAYFNWQALLANKFPATQYRPEQSLIIKGNVVVSKGTKKEPYKEENLLLMMRAMRDSLNTVLNVPVTANGDFAQPNLFFHDTASFYYQNNTQKKNKDVTVIFYPNETDSILRLPFNYTPYKKLLVTRGTPAAVRPAVNVPATISTDSFTLKNVTVSTKVKTHLDSLDEMYTSGIFSGNRAFSRIFDLTDDATAENDHVSNVLQFLQGRVPGLLITGDIQNLPEIYWRATTGVLIHNRAVDPISATILNMPVFFIDQRQVNTNQLIGGTPKDQLSPTITQLASVRVADIAMIKVFEPGTFYGVENGAAHGAIAIYLKRGYDADKTKNVNRIVKQGFSFTPSFTDNVFSTKDHETIYWNPDVITDATTHTATIRFTNNSGAKKIRIVVEGMDRKGRLCRVEKIVEQP